MSAQIRRASPSPYSKDFKICLQRGQKNLLMQRYNVGKHTRRELEDKYLNLCDENFAIKQENNININKIKFLRTKLMRVENITRTQHSRNSQPITEDELENISPVLDNEIKLINLDEFRNGRCAAGGGIRKKHSRPETTMSVNSVETTDASSSGSRHMGEEKSEIDKLNRKLAEEKSVNEGLRVQIEKLDDKVTTLMVQEKINENFTILQLKRNVEEKEQKIRQLDNDMQTSATEYVQRQTEIIHDLRAQIRIKNEEYEALIGISEHAEKLDMINTRLQDEITELTEENLALKKQIDNIKNLKHRSSNSSNTEESTDSQKLGVLFLSNERLNTDLEKLKEDHEVLTVAHDQLLEKTKNLQTENDTILIDTEGLKMQKMLAENRVVLLEVENKNMRMELEERKQKLHALDVKLLENQKPASSSIVRPNSTTFFHSPAATIKVDKQSQTPDDITADSESPVLPKRLILQNNSKTTTQSRPSLYTSPPDAIQKAATMILTNDKYHTEIDTHLSNAVSQSSSPRTSFSKVPDMKVDIKLIREEIAEIKRLITANSPTNKAISSKRPSISEDPRQNSDPQEDQASVIIGGVTSQPSVVLAGSRRTSMHDKSLYDKSLASSSKIKQTTVPGKQSNKQSSKQSSKQSVDFNKKSIMALFDIHTNDSDSIIDIGYVTFHIISLKFIENAYALTDPKLTQLYIEYTFLDYKGHLLETPQSLLMPRSADEELPFNFRQSFKIDLRTQKQIALIKDMLKPDTETPIRFLVINEPLGEEETSECAEVGFATLKLNTIVNKEATADKVSLIVPVHSIMYPHEQIANLNLSIEGILFLQGLL